MRSLDKKRRALFKNHYIFGTAKSVSGTDSVKIKLGSGTPLKSLEIKGQTEQKIELDQFKKYAEYFKNLDNYIDSGTTSIWVIPFPSEWLGKGLTFSLSEKTKMTDITFGVSDGTSLFANSKTLLDSSGNVLSVTSSAYSYFRFTGVLVDNLQKISEFWNSYELTVNGLLVDFPEPIKNANESGMKIILGDRMITIPKSVDVGGKTVELNMGKIGDFADSIVVDNHAKKVNYIQNTNRIVFTGNEAWVFHGVQPEYDIPNVWYRIGVSLAGNINASQPAWLKTGLGYSNLMQFSFAESAPNKEAWGFRFAYNNGTRLYVFTPPDAGLDTLANFKSFLQEKYAQGTPLIIEYACVTKIHDLTETELGRKLLSLCPPRSETSILQVNGELAGIPIKLEYYSREEAETVTLTIKYVDENGNEIKEPRVNNTRKGSKYLIIAPHIDGYKRVSTEVYGVSDEDTEIELLYRKK